MINHASFIQKWYELCLDFYSSASTPGHTQTEEFLECFASLASKSNETALQMRSDREYNRRLDMFNKILGVDIEELLNSDEGLWYHLNDLRNKARKEAHEILMDQRKRDCIQLFSEINYACENVIHKKNSLYGLILKNMNVLLKLVRRNEWLVSSMLGSVYTWLKKQLDDSYYCLSLTIDIDLIFERDIETQRSLCNALSAIGSFSMKADNQQQANTQPQWTMRENLSDAFIGRLIRMINRVFARYRVDSVNVYSSYSENVSNVSNSRRTNVAGSSDSAITKICNNTLPCPLL